MFDPDTWYVLTDRTGAHFDDVPNVTTYSWADEQVGFLAGVAAATTTETGIVGFVGAEPSADQEELRAGFEAGAKSVDPDIEVVAAYLAQLGYGDAPFDAPDGARYVAGLLYDGGADVIVHAAGRSGVGVLQAADSELAANNRWAIGVDSDEWQTASTRHRPHILTSIVKRFDEQIYTAIEDHLDGGLESGARRLTVADEMITYSLSGNALSPDARAELDRAIQRLASGEIQPPRRPSRSAHRAGVPPRTRNGHRILRRGRSRSDRHVHACRPAGKRRRRRVRGQVGR